jgi:hypothetical protein
MNVWCEHTDDALPENYEANLGEHVYLLEHEPEARRLGHRTEAYIDITHRPEHSLVAVLELLSPANKEQPGRTEYLAKRRALLVQEVHLVELDLLLGGRRLPMQAPLPEADYYYLLSRAGQRPDCKVYAWRLRQSLPTLPVPLRHPDPDVFIDLGKVFATAYERGKYGRKVDYHAEPPRQLSVEDRAWVRERLA